MPPGLVLGAVLLAAPSAPAGAAAWTTVEDGGNGAAPRAIVANAGGDRLALYRADGGAIRLEFAAGGAFSGLSPAICPTIQIDRRTPLHHPPIGEDCRIDGARATLALGSVHGRTLVSGLVYQLMNGDSASVRYVTTDDAYHEARFSLRRSAAAIRRALGAGVRVKPD